MAPSLPRDTQGQIHFCEKYIHGPAETRWQTAAHRASAARWHELSPKQPRRGLLTRVRHGVTARAYAYAYGTRRDHWFVRVRPNLRRSAPRRNRPDPRSSRPQRSTAPPAASGHVPPAPVRGIRTPPPRRTRTRGGRPSKETRPPPAWRAAVGRRPCPVPRDDEGVASRVRAADGGLEGNQKLIND